MRVMIAGSEAKGEDTPLHSVQPPSDVAVGQNGAGAAPSQQAVPSTTTRSSGGIPSGENASPQDRPSSASASSRTAADTDDQPNRTNGKQRASAAEARSGVSRAESSSGGVGLEGNVTEGRSGVPGLSHGTSAEGEHCAARRGAAGAEVSRESSLT